MLLSIFTDSDAVVRGKALEVLVRRSYRACGVSATSHLSVATQGPGIMGAKYLGKPDEVPGFGHAETDKLINSWKKVINGPLVVLYLRMQILRAVVLGDYNILYYMDPY